MARKKEGLTKKERKAIFKEMFELFEEKMGELQTEVMESAVNDMVRFETDTFSFDEMIDEASDIFDECALKYAKQIVK